MASITLQNRILPSLFRHAERLTASMDLIDPKYVASRNQLSEWIAMPWRTEADTNKSFRIVLSTTNLEIARNAVSGIAASRAAFIATKRKRLDPKKW